MFVIVVKGFVNPRNVLGAWFPEYIRRTGNTNSTPLVGGPFVHSNDNKIIEINFNVSAYIILAVPVEEQRQERVYSRFIEIPDDEGNMHLVDLEAEPDMAAIEEHTRNPNDNVYLLYTR